MSTIPSTKFRRNNILTEFPLTEFRQNSCRKIPRNSVEFFRRNKFPLNSAETFSEIPRKISAEFCKKSYGILYILHLFIINPWETFATFIVLLHLQQQILSSISLRNSSTLFSKSLRICTQEIQKTLNQNIIIVVHKITNKIWNFVQIMSEFF